jgi:carbonic anhydrase/acetyltransferase-like protein (isoleucine patch superfamily)
MLRRFQEASPKIHPSAYVHPSAELIGRVVLKKNASIWPMVVLRGDIEPITIGEDCNIQDSTVVHTTRKIPVTLAKGVTVGHGAILHGTRVGAFTLVGMGAILLDGSVIGKECLIGAGALVPENARIPPRSLVLGLPGKVVRKLRREELALLHRRAKDYVHYAQQHRTQSFPAHDDKGIYLS